jgi:hypothetical protein
MNIPFVLNVLLYGDEDESHETNSSVFQQVQIQVSIADEVICWRREN